MRIFLLLLFSALVSAQTVRVMSFNVRYPNPADGPDFWENRRDLLVDTVRKYAPDVMGTQELFKIQGDYIVEKLPAYAWFGTSRRGNDQDEHMGVFYRKDRLELKEQGQFWLSETPDVPASQSWNMSLPRMVTWGLFETKNGRQFYFLNTHFAHRREDEEARLKAAGVIASRIASLRKGVPIILTGDFNAPAGGAVYKAMLDAGLVDTRVSGTGPDGTFHGFKGKPGIARIDWILTSPGWKPLRNETITDSRDGHFPSDHFPVVAEVEYPRR